MIGHMLGGVLASASGSSGNGYFSRNTMVRSSGAPISSVAASSAWPKPSRAPQRLIEATQSRASTLVSSWNIRSGRSVRRQVLPSSSLMAPSAICGCARNWPSRPNSVSNTSRPWSRVW